MNSKILENIRAARIEQHITQANMAERMGLSVVAYSNFERGVTRTTQDRVELAAEILGLSFRKLVSGYGTEEEDMSLNEIKSGFENELREKDREIKDLKLKLKTAEELIASHEHTIEVLEQIRRMYERQLDKND